ncbi:hypothetical protein V1514DRAFT_342580 [Lipomyces japonicus]|uniref:uncharacterized protein n=1 Tax=Lipomyces japonicus TaxID=56871 RepID=UPI0034CE0D78
MKSSYVRKRRQTVRQTGLQSLGFRRSATRDPNLKPFCDVLKFDMADMPKLAADNAIRSPSDYTSKCFLMELESSADSQLFSNVSDMIEERNIKNLKTSQKTKQSHSYKNNGTALNAFIGFRSYYSRVLPGTNQLALSSVLSKIWASYKEKDQNFWLKYTVLYRSEPRLKCFADWLLERTIVPPELPGAENIRKGILEEKNAKVSLKMTRDVESLYTDFDTLVTPYFEEDEFQMSNFGTVFNSEQIESSSLNDQLSLENIFVDHNTDIHFSPNSQFFIGDCDTLRELMDIINSCGSLDNMENTSHYM